MALYQVANEVLESEVAFPELREAVGSATLHFAFGELMPPAALQHLRTIEQEDGRLWLKTGKSGDVFVLEFPDHGSFLFNPSADSVICAPAAGADTATLRHLFLDHVLPLICNQRSGTVLHASSVVSPSGGALVFVGKSGSGKSTLAATLAQHECTFLSDDFLLLDDAGRLRAVPAYPGMRLWETSTEQLHWDSRTFDAVASYTSKRKVSAGVAGLRFATEPVPIEAVFLVNQNWVEVSSVEISRMEAAEGLIALVGSTFCLDPFDQTRNKLDFQRLAHLVQTVPVMLLRFPYDFAQLPALRQAVLSAAARK